LFWRREEVNWAPGRGNRDAYRLLGRVGENRGTVRIADFRGQRGIYVLYDDYGPHYVGLSRKRDMGYRLRDHTRDHLSETWDRFSWFGFKAVLRRTHASGLSELGRMPARLLTDTDKTIADVEALLTHTLGTVTLGNKQSMRFTRAQEWLQVRRDEVERYTERL
jgi:hypothetical protein